MISLALALALKIVPPTLDMSYLQPQLASTGDMIGITFGSGNTLYYSYSTNDGETFSKPVSIPTGGKLALGHHRGPRIAYQAGNVVISAVVGMKGGGQDGDLLVWRSPDNGKSWSRPSRVNDVAGSAREGLHGMASGNGWVVNVWLDLRAKGTRLYLAKSTDGGATWEKNVQVYESADGSICQCCHPTVLVGPAGAIHVMFRNALSESRDMFYTLSRDAGATFAPAKKLGKDTWKLNACPMDGGGFAISSADNVYSVWRRDKKIYVARPDGKESEMGEGKDPVIASGLNESLYVVWSAGDGSLQMRTTKKDRVETLAAHGKSPQMVFTSNRVLAFWEEDGGIAMGTVEGPPPLTGAVSR